jgi:hypothetical protein
MTSKLLIFILVIFFSFGFYSNKKIFKQQGVLASSDSIVVSGVIPKGANYIIFKIANINTFPIFIDTTRYFSNIVEEKSAMGNSKCMIIDQYGAGSSGDIRLHKLLKGEFFVKRIALLDRELNYFAFSFFYIDKTSSIYSKLNNINYYPIDKSTMPYLSKEFTITNFINNDN